MNEILLRRKNKVILDRKHMAALPDPLNEQIVATMMKNIENLGYTLSQNVYDKLVMCTTDAIHSFYLTLIRNLKQFVGADIAYNPMYPNFPHSVMKRDESELYINAILHYWSRGTLLPVEERNERLPLFDDTTVKVIKLGTQNDLIDIFKNLISAKSSISEQDKQDIMWIFANRGNMGSMIPKDIPFKENVALVGKLYIENSALVNPKYLQQHVSTATDVLRLITALSDGDISLATDTKYRSFKRKERRVLLELLNTCNAKHLMEDMKKYKNRWIRIGERLHPGEYAKQYPIALTAFRALRESHKIETWSGNVAKAYKTSDYGRVVDLLKQRPGEFARELDHILRCTNKPNIVINEFKNVAAKVSSPVLLQVREHFKNRLENPEYRVFFPKGNVARVQCISNELPFIPDNISKAIILVCENALKTQYSEREFLGSVYLSKTLKNYTIPFSQRSASKALKTITRGSRLDVKENTNAFRGFIWWTNDDNHDRVDIDLSAAIFDANWNYMEHISYTNLRSKRYNACHSGDITNGGDMNDKGVSEFIDIDIKSVINYGARYLVFQVYSFNGQPFDKLPHAMFGWMEREDVKSGEIYEPKTVIQKMDLTARSTVAIPVVFDCITREVIWCDMNIGLDNVHRYGDNVERNLDGVAAACYGIVNISKPNLYDLIQLHINARGLETDNKVDADVVFDINDGITPFDTDIILSQYL